MTSWSGRTDVEIVVPVHDEQRVLQESIWRLHRYLSLHLPMEWRITIVDNASTDGTLAIPDVLAERSGLRIHEVPVDWTDDPDSRVDIRRTAIEDLKGIWRLLNDLGRHRLPVEAIAQELGRGPIGPTTPPRFGSQVLRFGVVG